MIKVDITDIWQALETIQLDLEGIAISMEINKDTPEKNNEWILSRIKQLDMSIQTIQNELVADWGDKN